MWHGSIFKRNELIFSFFYTSCHPKVKEHSQTNYHSWRENSWIYTFPKFSKCKRHHSGLNSIRHVFFSRQLPLYYEHLSLSLYIYIYIKSDKLIWTELLFKYTHAHTHTHTHTHTYIYIYIYGSARGVMVIVVGNGHGDTSSNPGRDWLHFT